MIRRRWIGTIAACALVLLWAGTFVEVEPPPVPEGSAPQRSAVAPVPRPVNAAPRQPVEMVVEDELLPALEDVAVSCGLDARPFCQDEACVALMRMPDLDRINGWFSMAYRSPRFVWSVVRRDMGIPEEVLSCGVAFDRLDRVASVALADGDEIWCAFDGSESQATLCDMAAAQRYGLSGAEFRRDDLRYLSFERP